MGLTSCDGRPTLGRILMDRMVMLRATDGGNQIVRWVKIRCQRTVNALLGAVLLTTMLAQGTMATDNLSGSSWDAQQNGIYNYSPRWYYPDSSMSTTCRSRFLAGATVWNNVGTELRFAYGTGYAKWIKVSMTDAAWPFNGVYAWANVDPFGGISNADITFNSDVDVPGGGRKYPYCGTATPPVNYYDLWGVAAHELGHTIALDHSGVSADTMYAYGSTCGCGDAIRWRTLTAHDISGIRAKYANAQ